MPVRVLSCAMKCSTQIPAHSCRISAGTSTPAPIYRPWSCGTLTLPPLVTCPLPLAACGRYFLTFYDFDTTAGVAAATSLGQSIVHEVMQMGPQMRLSQTTYPSTEILKSSQDYYIQSVR